MWNTLRRTHAARSRHLLVPFLLFFPAMANAQAAGSIAGRVTGPDGDPLSMASVEVLESDRQTVTDRAGGFRISGIPEGAHRLVVSYMGFQPDTASISVSSGAAATVDVVLNIAPIALEGISVEGERGGQLRAINRERQSTTVTDVVSGDDIGRLPDQNVAEAVQRVSGMAIRTSRGEGRFVSIRGRRGESSCLAALRVATSRPRSWIRTATRRSTATSSRMSWNFRWKTTSGSGMASAPTSTGARTLKPASIYEVFTPEHRRSQRTRSSRSPSRVIWRCSRPWSGGTAPVRSSSTSARGMSGSRSMHLRWVVSEPWGRA
ncbi:MAG: TonB-dependent receptor plug domain-containing protein [Gemmatimonas sp.]|nr:TonB-dependent receptor plug domain-containing protein [Gemmatimonas sp.]